MLSDSIKRPTSSSEGTLGFWFVRIIIPFGSQFVICFNCLVLGFLLLSSNRNFMRSTTLEILLHDCVQEYWR